MKKAQRKSRMKVMKVIGAFDNIYLKTLLQFGGELGWKAEQFSNYVLRRKMF